MRQYPQACGLAPHFSLFNSQDQLGCLRRILEEKAWSQLYKPEELQSQISLCKNLGLGHKELSLKHREKLGIWDMSPLLEIYPLYERHLQLYNAMDFDDCILKVLELMRRDSWHRDRIQKRYPYLLVDEFQDTNACQFSLLHEMSSSQRNLCVVGDDDQSIYGWRGALYQVLQRFESCFPEAQVIKLEQNYRCSPNILAVANHLIAHNKERKGKSLWSQGPQGPPVCLQSYEDNIAEARGLAEQCLSLLGQGYRPKDVAVLYRAKHQAKVLELALREARLPYHCLGSSSFFQRKEIKDFFSYLKLILQPQSQLPFWEVLNTPPRGLGLKSQEKLEKIANEQGCQPRELLERKELLQEHFNLAQQKAMEELQGGLEYCGTLPLEEPQDLEKLGQEILERFQLIPHLEGQLHGNKNRHSKVQQLKGLPSFLKTLGEKQLLKGREKKFQEMLDALSLGEEQKKEQEEEKNAISLMTIHAAKGLEFPCVFVLGLEEELLPHRNALEHGEKAIGEERRLFYVAITRAKKHLFLSHSHLKQLGTQKIERKASRFLEELPQDKLLQKGPHGSMRKGKEELKKQTLDRLASLRQLLGG